MAGQRRTFSVAFKKEVIDFMGNGNSSYQAVKHFEKKYKSSYDASNFRRWFENRNTIGKLPANKSRVPGAGRKALLGNIEDVLYDEILDLRISNIKVTRTFLRDRAMQLATENQISFTASACWCTNFMNRMKLSLRRTTNLTLLAEDEIVARAVGYMSYLQKIKLSCDPSKTLLMDETAIYMEDSRTQTIDLRGRKHVVMKTTGFASMRLTVVAAVWANGQKGTPMVIHKGPNSDIKSSGGVAYTSQPRSWVDSQLLIKWIDHMFPLVDTSDGRTLVWDSCRSHISKDIKAHCAKRRIQMVVIPGGMTPYLQAGDIGIYKSFKDEIGSLITTWKNSSAVEFTRAGNPKPPKPEVVNDWVKSAWQAVPKETIQNSVRSAGFAFNHCEWHIAKHDIYGSKFISSWEFQNGPGLNEADSICSSDDDFMIIEPASGDETE